MQMRVRQRGQFTRLNLLLSTITMPQAKTTRGRLKPVSCPRCGKKFCSETNVLQHMNQPTGSCYTDFFSETLLGSEFSPDVPTTESGAEQGEISTAANEVDFEMEHDATDPTPSEPVNPIVPGDQPRWFGSEPEFVEVYEGCAERFPGGKNFMDEFRNDRYAEERRQNLYFPWASRQEWAFASWLLRSRLSMAAIDSLLSLELVSNSLYIRCIAFNYASDKRSFVVLSFCEGITCSCRDAACWPAMVM